MVAMFVLFDFVVHNPTHIETRRNLSYLDIVAAYFSRLELASHGQVKGSVIAEFALVARQCVQNYTKPCNDDDREAPPCYSPGSAQTKNDEETRDIQVSTEISIDAVNQSTFEPVSRFKLRSRLSSTVLSPLNDYVLI